MHHRDGLTDGELAMDKPGPYMDFEDFNLKEGSTVGFKALGGRVLFGKITHIEHNRAAGTISMTVDPEQRRTAMDVLNKLGVTVD